MSSGALGVNLLCLFHLLGVACVPGLAVPPSTLRGSSVGSSGLYLALTFPPPSVTESKLALLAA